MKKLRLLVTEDCDRSCPGCCNKDWDLAGLPVLDLTKPIAYDEVILTGGEPLLHPTYLVNLVEVLRTISPPSCKVYVYTACPSGIPLVLGAVDGVTLTLHEQSDIWDFGKLLDGLTPDQTEGKSLRLNVFRGVKLPDFVDLSAWKVKADVVWKKDCPLPADEEFWRL
jgi:hypothetical protein